LQKKKREGGGRCALKREKKNKIKNLIEGTFDCILLKQVSFSAVEPISPVVRRGKLEQA